MSKISRAICPTRSSVVRRIVRQGGMGDVYSSDAGSNGEAPDLCGGRGLFCLVSTAGTAGRDFSVQFEARTQTSIPLAAYCTSAGHCDSAL